MSCEICKFRNPRVTSTAIHIKDNKVLVVKRAQEPEKGEWDFIGGFAHGTEQPIDALKREVKEELGVESVTVTEIGTFPGTYTWKGQTYPILSHSYLVELGGPPILNEENSEYEYKDIKTLEKVAFDSNNDILAYLKQNFVWDLARVQELLTQLDPTARLNEQYLYKAALNGGISKVFDGPLLIGFGCIFPRQTFLRKQAIIEDMIISQEYRGQGGGRLILKDLISWARLNKCDTIELTTNPKRIAANELYKSEGFKLHETNHYLLAL